MLSSEQIEMIRTEINGRLKQVSEQIESLKEQCKPVKPDSSLGRITRMDAIQQKSMAEENLRSAQRMVRTLQATLLRLDDSNFGICNMCKGEIPVERIIYLPEARTCVSCAS